MIPWLKWQYSEYIHALKQDIRDLLEDLAIDLFNYYPKEN